jgi:ribosomal protein S18 acetylase RimI-like enzyme
MQAGHRGLMPDDFLDGFSVQDWAEGWAMTLKAMDPRLALVAVRDGAIVGLCRVATPSRDEDTGGVSAEFVAVYVSPDAWRSGVGTALMTHALDALRRDRWRAASLWVAEGNDRALRFYEQFGFKLDGSSAAHRPSGAREVRMRLLLADAVA